MGQTSSSLNTVVVFISRFILLTLWKFGSRIKCSYYRGGLDIEVVSTGGSTVNTYKHKVHMMDFSVYFHDFKTWKWSNLRGHNVLAITLLQSLVDTNTCCSPNVEASDWWQETFTWIRTRGGFTDGHTIKTSSIGRSKRSPLQWHHLEEENMLIKLNILTN